MSSSYSTTESVAFTITHAREMAAKVATDLKRLQRLYSGGPDDEDIAAYEAEAVELLKAGCLGTVTYGFFRDGNWIEPSLFYTARDLDGATANNDDPGKIQPGADITGAKFWSYLTYSPSWEGLSSQEQENLLSRLPFRRTGALKPGVKGYLVEDRTYSSGGRCISRSSVRSY